MAEHRDIKIGSETLEINRFWSLDHKTNEKRLFFQIFL